MNFSVMLYSRFKPFLEHIVFSFFTVLPSTRALLKFGNIWILITYIVCVNFFFYFFRKRKLIVENYVKGKYLYLFLIILITAFNYFIYPKVDARKFSGNHGSTADDAVIISSKTLQSSWKLYDVTLFTKVPISPGPGWIILNSPFALMDVYFLFIPFYLICTLFAINKFYDSKKANLFLLFILIPAIFWELLFNGHDIVSFSLAFFILAILTDKLLFKEVTSRYAILIGILLGVVSTSRVIFFFIPFVFYFAAMFKSKKNANVLLVSSLFVFLFFNSLFYYINPNYQPLHLFKKAYNIMGLPLLTLAGFNWVVFLFFIMKNKASLNLNEKIFWIFCLFFIPVSLLDLKNMNFDFKTWEGANYLFPIIPFYIFKIINRNNG